MMFQHFPMFSRLVLASSCQFSKILAKASVDLDFDMREVMAHLSNDTAAGLCWEVSFCCLFKKLSVKHSEIITIKLSKHVWKHVKARRSVSKQAFMWKRCSDHIESLLCPIVTRFFTKSSTRDFGIPWMPPCQRLWRISWLQWCQTPQFLVHRSQDRSPGSTKWSTFCIILLKEWCCMILYSNVRSIQTYFGLAAWLSPVVWRCVISSTFREQWVEGVVLWACILVATFELRLWPGSSSAFSPVLLLMWRWRSMNRFAKIWFEACHLWTCHMAHWSLCTARLSACIPQSSAVPTLHWRPWTSFRRWSFLTERGIPHETVVTSIFFRYF